MIAQAYLCRAGLDVLSIDRLDRPGGGLRTEEDPAFPGFRHNTHAVFCRAVTSLPWYRDLELERHGAVMIEPEMNSALITKDGNALQWWTDLERTYRSVADFSKKDADTLLRWVEEFQPIVTDILRPELAAPPLSAEERGRLLRRFPAGRRLLEVSELSPLEFVTREFSHPVVQAALLFFNGLREVDMRVKGFGHHIVMLLASPAKAQMPKGGTGALGKAIASAVKAAGGDILLDTPIKRILVESLDQAFMTILGIDDLETYRRMVECHEVGAMPPGPILYGACQSIHDPTQAPAGKHTAFMWQKVPFHLYGDPNNWERYGQQVGEEMLAQWRRYAPNLGEAVESWFVRTPLDTVRTLPTMGEGDTIGGGFLNGQYLDGRPWKGAGHYRAHLEGLYLCGMATHPGGNVTGLPGYNAAQVILADLGVAADWAPPPMQARLERLAGGDGPAAAAARR
jgi:phytoene dehydrogenase-like protein